MTDSNSTELSFARQTAYKSGLPAVADFRLVERSDLSQFGNTYAKAEPTRISRNRNPRKRRTNSVDSGVEFQAPLDIGTMIEFGQGFTYGKPAGPAFFNVTSVMDNELSIGAIPAGVGATIIPNQTIVAIKGLKGTANTANRGQFLITGPASDGDTSIAVTGVVAENIAANRRAEVYIAGVRGAAGDIGIDADGNLTSTTLDFTSLGLVVDQAIYIGGTDDANGFAEESNYGFAQIMELTANKITLYNRDRNYVADDGAGVQIDILFGPLLRNYPIGHDSFQRLFYTFGLSTEFTIPAPKTTYEYAKDNACDSMSIAMEDEFASVTFGFVGSQTTLPSEVPAGGHLNAAPMNQTAEFATNVDLVQFALNRSNDGTNLGTDFDDLTLTIANGAVARKVRGTVVPSQINIGKFRVSIDYTAIFSNSDILEAISCDKELSLRFPLWNDDGGLYFHIPQLEMDGGDRSFPPDESVTIQTTGNAYNEDIDGSCLNITVFPLLPAKPCAVG